MVEWIVKRLIVGNINKLLLKVNIVEATGRIALWIVRLEKILVELKKLNERFSDGELTRDELEETTNDVKRLVKDF